MKRSNYKWCQGSRVGNDTRQTSSDSIEVWSQITACFDCFIYPKSQPKVICIMDISMDTKPCKRCLFPGIAAHQTHQLKFPPLPTTKNNEQRTSNKQQTTNNEQRTTNTNQPTIHQRISEPTTNNQQPTTNNTSACIFSTVNPQPLRHLVLRSFQRTDRSCQRSWYEGIPQPPWSTSARDTKLRMLCYVSEFSIP